MKTMGMRRESDWTARAATIIPPPRRSDLLEEHLDGQVLIVDPRNASTHRLNEAALAVWQECDGKASTRQIAEQLSELCEVDFDHALDWTSQLVARFAELELLEG